MANVKNQVTIVSKILAPQLELDVENQAPLDATLNSVQLFNRWCSERYSEDVDAPQSNESVGSNQIYLKETRGYLKDIQPHEPWMTDK